MNESKYIKIGSLVFDSYLIMSIDTSNCCSNYFNIKLRNSQEITFFFDDDFFEGGEEILENVKQLLKSASDDEQYLADLKDMEQSLSMKDYLYGITHLTNISNQRVMGVLCSKDSETHSKFSENLERLYSEYEKKYKDHILSYVKEIQDDLLNNTIKKEYNFPDLIEARFH